MCSVFFQKVSCGERGNMGLVINLFGKDVDDHNGSECSSSVKAPVDQGK